MLKHQNKILLFLVFIWFFFNHFASDFIYPTPSTLENGFSKQESQFYQQQKPVSFNQDIKPLLDTRCVVCHGCYDAPCQLKLSSYAGMDRGATKQLVYDPERLEPIPPTRLFVDAETTAEWREKDFYSVLNPSTSKEQDDKLNASLVARLLKLKQNHPLPTSEKLDKSFKLDIERDLQCPTLEELPKYEQQHPDWGMPYALPGLSKIEQDKILSWIQQGAKKPPKPRISDQTKKEIIKWEKFFNDTSIKQQLVSRYIYEHLFIGHLHFSDTDDSNFYKLVRSKKPSGQKIQEIATVLPYEDPGSSPFYYRFRPVTATILDKNHFVYALNDKRMQRYQELFFNPDYRVTALPTYQLKSAANPFKTFIEIPLKSRYQFLLDEAEYFFSGFIKGPVCRGQVAINVIRDQFWVAFVNPELHYADQNSEYLAKHTESLEMPGSSGHDIGLTEWFNFGRLGHYFLKVKDQYLSKTLLHKRGADLDFLWDGDQQNKNASLTVFRHFNSATVTKGFVGDVPLTGWIVDYSIFERIHYLLVASFDVYGSLAHQVAIRTYMDYIRMDAENNFLRFMPAKARKPIYDNWYQSVDAKLFSVFREPYFSVQHETQVDFQTENYKAEFFDKIREYLGPAGFPRDPINQCLEPPCIRQQTSPQQQAIDRQMQQLAKLRGQELAALPEVTFLRIETDAQQDFQAYTLFVNTSLSSLSSFYGEKLRRLPEQDSVTVIPGLIGSYPNFFFNIKADELSEFIEILRNAKTQPQKQVLYSRFGIRRTNPKIWTLLDWFHEKQKQDLGIYFGLFDLNRYKNL